MIKYDPDHYPPESVAHIEFTSYGRDMFRDSVGLTAGAQERISVNAVLAPDYLDGSDEVRAYAYYVGSDIFANLQGDNKPERTLSMAKDLLIKEFGEAVLPYMPSYLEGIQGGIEIEAREQATDQPIKHLEAQL